MYDLDEIENVISFATSNIQIVGIFIAVMGGLIASKIIGLNTEKSEINDKIGKIKKEINFYEKKLYEKEHKLYIKKKEDYMNYIYDKILEDMGEFNVDDYDEYELTREQRLEIFQEIIEIYKKAYEIFKGEYYSDDIEITLKENNIKDNTIEYNIMLEYAYKFAKSSNKTYGIFSPEILNLPDMTSVRINSKITSLQENLRERDLKNDIEQSDYFLKWKKLELIDYESKIVAINKNVTISDEIVTFIIISIIGIIIPQIFIAFNGLIPINCFRIISIFSFGISVILIFTYLLWLLLGKNEKNVDIADNTDSGV